MKLLPPPSPNRAEYPFVASLVFQGIPVDIEQRKGDTREGVDADGKPWKVRMHAHYGEIRSHVRGAAGVLGARGMDGDRLDVYVGPDIQSDIVVVVNQRIPETGAFDEQKVMLGFPTVARARACYRAQYTKPGFYGGHVVMSVEDFKRKIATREQSGRAIKKGLAMTTPLASLLNRIAADLRKGAAKPPAGFSPIPGSKHGGYHKQVAGHWETWYPGGAGGGRPVRRKFGDQSSSAGSHVAKLAIREPGKEQTSGLTIEAHGPHGGYKTAHWDAARHSVRDDGDTATHATLGEAHDWVHQRLSGGNVAKAGALVFASSGSPCVAPLLRLLQATQTLGATAQHFHWNVKGPHFHSLHEMFGEQYDSAIATQDDIAERIRALGADVPAPPVVSPDTMPASMMVATLAAMQETGARLAREAAACAESVNDQATIDLVGKVQRDAEKAAWMLRATLGEQAQGNPVLIGMAKAARAMMSRTR